MRVVSLNLEVVKAVIEDRFRFTFDNQLRQCTRFTGQLEMRLFHVVAVQVRIPTGQTKSPTSRSHCWAIICTNSA